MNTMYRLFNLGAIQKSSKDWESSWCLITNNTNLATSIKINTLICTQISSALVACYVFPWGKE